MRLSLIHILNRLPGALHIACGDEIAKLGIEDAAAVGGLQGMIRREAGIGARRVDMVARGMLPVLFRRNLLRTEVDDAEKMCIRDRLKIIRAADGGSAIAEVLTRHIVEAALERDVYKRQVSRKLTERITDTFPSSFRTVCSTVIRCSCSITM